jgi:hypothetical protein
MLEQGGKLYDVFLSYSSRDEDLVKRIDSRLRAQGLRVWFAPSSIRGGDQFPQEIEEGLRKSQTVVVVISPSSVKSFWVRREWEIRLVQMSQDRTRKLIPLWLLDCDMPLLLSNQQYIDFRDVDFNDLTAFEEKLQELVDSIRDALPPPGVEAIGIPVAVITMTQKEAEELASREIFSSPRATEEQRKRFDKLADTLKEQGLGDFVDRYADLHEDWRPFENDSRTVRDIIEGFTEWINKMKLAKSEPVIRPQYYSSDFWSLDIEIRGRTWQYLDHFGCVLVLDGISMFHPDIQSTFLKSQLGASNRVALVGLSPLNPRTVRICQLLEEEMSERLQRAFERYAKLLDPQCAFEVGDERALMRWLYFSLPQMAEAIQGRRADPKMIEMLQRLMGPPGGIGRLIFSEERVR